MGRKRRGRSWHACTMTRLAAAAPPGDRDDVRDLAAWSVVALLAVAHAAPFFVTFVEGDFARDLYAALRITQGRAWPTEGPIISGTLYLGPVWYYAIAAVMKLGGSLTAVVAAIAIASSLQFPLAYVLGREALDRATGLAWAAMLALPGVGSLASLWIAHPSLVPTLVLLVLLATWRARARASAGWLAFAGLAFGLALHAHPTTLPLALPIAWVGFERVRSEGRKGIAGAFAAVVLAALPFAPLLAGWGQHAAAAVRLSSQVAEGWAALRPEAFATVVAAVVWRVPDLLVGTWVSADGTPMAAWRAYAVALGAAAAWGIVRSAARGQPSTRSAAAWAVLALVAWLAFVVAIRDVTRFYMLYAPWPVLALVLALGLRSLDATGGSRSAVARALVAGAIAWAVALGAARVGRALSDDVRLPPLLGAQVDLRRNDTRAYTRLHYLSVRHLDAIGKRLCVDGRVHVFAELAQVVDSQFNVAAQIRCGDASRVVIGGLPGPGEHAFFLLQRAALAPRVALRDFGGFGFGRVAEVLVPNPALPLARGDDYPSRKGCGDASVHRFAFETRDAATLVIANGLAITCPMRIVRLERDGASVEPATFADSAFAGAPAGPARWTLAVETAAPEAVQVFTVGRPGEAAIRRGP